mgnify:FL=1
MAEAREAERPNKEEPHTQTGIKNKRMSKMSEKIKMPPKKLYGRDDFQTPKYGVEPLLKYIPKDWIIWECAEGIGNITSVFRDNGYKVIGTDISKNREYDFFTFRPNNYDIVVTNPPYSEKDKWLKRCYNLNKPFALLLPLTALEGSKRQELYRKYGLQVILLNRRINFVLPKDKAPEKSSSWFASAWFTWGLNLPSDLVFETIMRR